MNETIIYTYSRPRAKSTGHAFVFEGNLGMPVIVSGMLSVFILTLLLNGDNRISLFVKFLLSLLPTVLTTAYVVVLSSRRPPRFDLDLFASWVNGRSFQPARIPSICSNAMIDSFIGAFEAIFSLGLRQRAGPGFARLARWNAERGLFE